MAFGAWGLALGVWASRVGGGGAGETRERRTRTPNPQPHTPSPLLPCAGTRCALSICVGSIGSSTETGLGAGAADVRHRELSYRGPGRRPPDARRGATASGSATRRSAIHAGDHDPLRWAPCRTRAVGLRAEGHCSAHASAGGSRARRRRHRDRSGIRVRRRPNVQHGRRSSARARVRSDQRRTRSAGARKTRQTEHDSSTAAATAPYDSLCRGITGRGRRTYIDGH